MITFDPFPELETPRLRLRQILPTDAEIIRRLQSDPEVTRFFGRPPEPTITEAERRIATITAGIRDQISIGWGITLRGAPELVGTAGFPRWNKAHRSAEVGYVLLSAWWGRGIMTEAVRAILAFGFEALELHRVEAMVDPENAASVRVLERLGFTRDGLLRESWLHAGRFTDTGLYGLLDREFGRAG